MGDHYPGTTRAELDRTLSDYLQEVSLEKHGSNVPEIADVNEPTDDTRFFADAGIIKTFSNRKEALHYFSAKLDRAQKVVVVGSSLRGLLHPAATDWETRAILRERVSLQRASGSEPPKTTDFVLTHPAFADLRASQENREKQDIAVEILESLMYLKEWDTPPGSVYLYLGTPTCFGVLADDQMILNPYPYAEVAFQSPCLLLQDSGYFFNAFVNSHFGVVDRTMAVRLVDLPADIGELYWSLSEFQLRTSELLARARELTARENPHCDADGGLCRHPGFIDIAAAARKRHDSSGPPRVSQLAIPADQ